MAVAGSSSSHVVKSRKAESGFASFAVPDPHSESTWPLGRVLSGRRFDRESYLPAFVIRRLPPAPRDQRVLPGDDWQALRPYISWGIVVSALGMLGAVLLAVDIPAVRVTAWALLHGLATSAIEGHARPADFYPSPGDADGDGERANAVIRVLLTIVIVLASRWLLRRIPRFALWEEQAFREGAERWSIRERLQSAHIFGWAHFLNMFYPLATVCALMGGGWIFMVCYLQEYRTSRDSQAATYAATALHSVYNALAVALIAGSVLVFLWF